MNEPSLDAALEGAEALEGWGFFEHAQEPRKGDAEAKAASERGQRVAANLARLYASDPAFSEALDFLLDSTLRRATFTAALGLDPMQAYAFGVFREGQNSFATALLKLIAIGRKERPEPGREP
ncbi:MAG: hypothetical protein WAU78_08270 [Roseiarcus sp.]